MNDLFFNVDHLKPLLNLLQYCFYFTFWFFWPQACGLSSPAAVFITKSCPTLCDPIDCSLSSSSVYEIFQWSGDSLLVQLVKNPPANAGDPGSIHGLGRSPGKENGYSPQYSWASLEAQMVKNLPAMGKARVQSLGWDYPLEKRMATCSSILACRIPGTEEPGGLLSMGSHRVGHD